ncbi:choline monooxygenase [Sphingobacteriales bacterium UPWRP_1]|nr:choline monooxygenase [Sphingobacteriales bacterium TSM_CSM]PSJ71998.1 choline monooxygenase [Sphingobacteriales bacterium UPWRP_1]
MSENPLFIHPDITRAETLPAWFYRNPQLFELQKQQVFAKTWQWVGHEHLLPLPEWVYPFLFMEHFVEEPMLLVRQKNGQTLNLSNVCTHRGNMLYQEPAQVQQLICRYHGRRFYPDGQFKSMPEFTGVQQFPRPCDSLHRFPLAQWGPFLFTSIQPAFGLQEIIGQMQLKVGFLPLHQFVFDKSRSKDYLVHGHWALYCDNYLEGFHIPFVHRDLNAALDYGNYTVETGNFYCLQTGYANNAADAFTLPPGHPDFGKQVAAYYFWVFPNMMFNFYPWGLSVNIVKPVAPARTRVSFLTYVYDERRLDTGAGALLDKVEREDEFVVESVQKGIQSVAYQTGRYSPAREQGVHHFHRLLTQFLNGEAGV